MSPAGMRTLRFVASGAVVAVCIAVAGSATAAGDPAALITVPGGNQLVLRRAEAIETRVTFTVPIAVAAGVQPGALRARLVAVVRDGAQQMLPGGAIAVYVDPLVSGPALLVVVDFAQRFAPGTYQLMVSIASSATPPSPPTSPPARDEQLLTLTVTVPAATLRSIPSVVIDREDSWISTVDGPATIEFHESGNLAPVTLSVSQDGSLVCGDHPIGGRVQISGPLRIDAGDQGTGQVSLDGVFPMGVAKGNLSVIARELAAPITIPIEVRTHRPPWSVLVLFAIGTAIGFVWRTLLRERRDGLVCELAASDLTMRIDAVLAVQPVEWAADVTNLQATRDAIDPRNGSTLRPAEAGLTQAIDRRNERSKELQARIIAGIEVTRAKHALPLGLELGQAAASYGLAFSKLQERALADAVDHVRAGDNAVSVVVERCRAWCARLDRDLSGLAGGVPGCPGPARLAVATATARLVTALADADAVVAGSGAPAEQPAASPPPGAAAPQPAPAQPPAPAANAAAEPALAGGRRGPDFARVYLASMQEAWWRASELARTLYEGLERFQRSLPATLEQAAAVRAAADVPPYAAEHPENAIAAAVESCRALTEVIQTSVQARFGQAVPETVTRAMERGDYAAVFAAQVPRPVVIADGGRGAPITGQVPPPPPLVESPSRGELRPTAPATVIVAAEISSVERPVPRRRVVIRRELHRVLVARWLLAAAVTSTIAYALYGGAFVGTVPEILGIFTAGFITDLTSDSALEGLLGRFRPKADAADAVPAVSTQRVTTG
jgi:hypothetical protein